MSDTTGGQEFPDSAGYPDGEGTLDEGTGGFEPAEDEDDAQVADPATPDAGGSVPGSGTEDMDAHGGSIAGTAGAGASGEVPD